MGGNQSAFDRSVETVTCPVQLTAMLNNTMGLDLDSRDTDVLRLAIKRNGGRGLTMKTIRDLVDLNIKNRSSVLGGGDGIDLLQNQFCKAEQYVQSQAKSFRSANIGIYHKAEIGSIKQGGNEIKGGESKFNSVSIFGDGGEDTVGVSSVSMFSNIGGGGGEESEVSMFSNCDTSSLKGGEKTDISLGGEETVSLFSNVTPSLNGGGEESKVSLFSNVTPSLNGGGEGSKVSLFSNVTPPLNGGDEGSKVSLFSNVDDSKMSSNDVGKKKQVSLFNISEMDSVSPKSQKSFYDSPKSFFSETEMSIETNNSSGHVSTTLPQFKNNDSILSSPKYSMETTTQNSVASRMKNIIHTRYRI